MKHARSRLRFRVGLFASLAALLLSLAGTVPSRAESSPDYAMTNGWFYSQTGGGNGQGYAVLNAGSDRNGNTIKFWTVFQRLGGVGTLGYPVSQPYVGADGFTYQAFQGGVLQWRPELGDAVLANTFDILETSGLGGWLTDAKGLPAAITDDGSGGNFQQAMATRLTWLTDPAIKEKFLANPNPQVIAEWNDGFGLPKSRPEQHGPFVSQLFQRISIQRWTVAVPGMPPVGSVVVVLGGDLLKEAGLIPASATQVLGPNGVALVTAAPEPAAPAPSDYPWTLRQVGTLANCGTSYLTVTALDANGKGVNGLTIRSWNDDGNVHEEGTRNHNGADGYSDRVVSLGPRAGKWYVMLLDGEGRQSSDVATVTFTATCDAGQGAVNQVALELREKVTTPAAAPAYPSPSSNPTRRSPPAPPAPPPRIAPASSAASTHAQPCTPSGSCSWGAASPRPEGKSTPQPAHPLP